MSARDHSRYQEEVGAYLLGALGEPESQAYEEHMSQCPSCRDEVEWLRPAADALPRSVEQVAPPPSLKDSLMQVVEQEARERGYEETAPARPARERRPWLRMGALRPVLVVAALAAGVAGGFAAARLSEGPESRTVAATVDRERIPDGSARLQLQDDGEDGAILRVQGMPELSPNRVYQAWIQRDGRIVPQPTFVVGNDGRGTVGIPEDLSGAQRVLVTREPRGGASAPTEDPIIAVRL